MFSPRVLLGHLQEDRAAEFLWRQLEVDLELLGRAVGRSVDDAAILLHLVLRLVLTTDPPKSVCVCACVVCVVCVCEYLTCGQ